MYENSGSRDEEYDKNEMEEDNNEASDDEISIQNSIAKKKGLLPNDNIPRISTKEKLQKIIEEERCLNTSANTSASKRTKKKIKAFTKSKTRNVQKIKFPIKLESVNSTLRFIITFFAVLVIKLVAHNPTTRIIMATTNLGEYSKINFFMVSM